MTRKDRVSNARIRGTEKMREVWKKTQEARLRQYRHVIRSDGKSDEKRTLEMKGQG